MVNDTMKNNLADRIEEQLPAAVVSFLRKAGELAQQEQQRLYLVGGVVRDILLRRISLDFDLVVEGDAIALARKLARTNRAVITTHPRFGTAKYSGITGISTWLWLAPSLTPLPVRYLK